MCRGTSWFCQTILFNKYVIESKQESLVKSFHTGIRIRTAETCLVRFQLFFFPFGSISCACSEINILLLFASHQWYIYMFLKMSNSTFASQWAHAIPRRTLATRLTFQSRQWFWFPLLASNLQGVAPAVVLVHWEQQPVMGILINFSFTGCETTMQEVTVWTKTFGIVWVSSPRKPDRETVKRFERRPGLFS